MSSASKLLLYAMFMAGCCSIALAQASELRVCADPNNMPYSNASRQGFENKLAQLVARDLGMTLTYVWEPQRSTFFRKTLNAGRCDVVMEVPSTFGSAGTTMPYYTSTYVFVTRRNRNLHLRSLDDPALRSLRIGVHIVGDDYAALPPARALANRGVVRNVVGYSIYGTLSEKDPAARLIYAVANGDLDAAMAWGPLAGYFAEKSPVALEVVPICSNSPDKFAPMVFSISMGVRRNDQVLRQKLNAVIDRRRSDIRRVLESYHVPFAVEGAERRCPGGGA